MKQGIRFIVKPNTFFSQLQWSRNHWMIIASFLTLALVETQIGRHQQLYSAFASFLQYKWSVGSTAALWIVMAARLGLMLGGAFVMSTVIYLVGSVVGRANSRRVLFRRLSCVFTVFLAGFAVQHYSDVHPDIFFVAVAFYVWGTVLGYICIRAQFELNHLETALVAAFAVLLVTTSWKFSNRVIEVTMRQQMHSLSVRPMERPTANQFRLGTGL